MGKKSENMRIDKFLKVSRIIKRRSVAQEACSSGRIEINGRPAKPAKDVKVDDMVKIIFGDKEIVFKVLNISEHQTKQSAGEMYEIISTNYKDEEEDD